MIADYPTPESFYQTPAEKDRLAREQEEQRHQERIRQILVQLFGDKANQIFGNIHFQGHLEASRRDPHSQYNRSPDQVLYAAIMRGWGDLDRGDGRSYSNSWGRGVSVFGLECRAPKRDGHPCVQIWATERQNPIPNARPVLFDLDARRFFLDIDESTILPSHHPEQESVGR